MVRAVVLYAGGHAQRLGVPFEVFFVDVA